MRVDGSPLEDPPKKSGNSESALDAGRLWVESSARMSSVPVIMNIKKSLAYVS